MTADSSRDRKAPAAAGMETLRAIEADLALFEPSLAGFSLWPVFRFAAWQLVSGVTTGALPGGGRTLLRRAGWLGGLATYGAWSAFRRRALKQRRFDFLFLTLETHRLASDDGWWDPYLDDVAAALAGRVLRVERRDFMPGRARTPATRHLFADSQLIDRLRGVARSPESGPRAAQVCDLFFQGVARVGAHVDPATERAFRARAAAMAGRFHAERVWYEALLGEFRPKAVALVDAYNQHGLVAASKASGIPVVEFQHGSIHPDHPGYVWFANARVLRDRLPIPDRIATYGSFWSDVLTQEGFWQPAEVPAVGSARLDRARAHARRRSDSTLRIVFTSQFATRGRTIPLLREFVPLAEGTGLDYALTIKVHRGERELVGDYEALRRLSPRVSVVSPYQGDTLAMIADADVHVSAWSTCHYEAVALGTPTVVLVFPGPDRVEGLNGFSSVFRATTAGELVDCVRRARDARATASAAFKEESERLFRHRAVENAAALLEDVAAKPG